MKRCIHLAFCIVILIFQAASIQLMAQNDVVINEIMASNTDAVADNEGEYDDWIELYNPTGSSIDISGYFLTDKPDNLDKWELPSGTVIEADSYLIIWADEDSSQGPYHCNFKLAAAGETLILLDPDTQMVDQVMFGQQTTDMGYARVPNGTGNFVIQEHTFKNNNVNPTSVDPYVDRDIAFTLYPNPSTGVVYVMTTETRRDIPLSIMDNLGQVIWSGKLLDKTLIETKNWPAGLYTARSGNTALQLVVVQ